MVLEAYEARADTMGRGRKGCPPHGPHVIDGVDGALLRSPVLEVRAHGTVVKRH